VKYRIKSLRQQFFDAAAARQQRARNAATTRQRLDRRDLMLGLAMFIMATHERPPLDDVKPCFASSSTRNDIQSPRLRQSIQDLL
jgi:hypothetical protein